MSQETNKLTSMVKAAPGQVEGLGKSIDAVQDEMDSLQSEINAVTDGVCGTTEADARDIIDNTILPDHSGNTDSTSEIIIYFVTYGSTFGDINWIPAGNLTDWAIRKSVTPIPPPILPPVIVTVYSYTPGDYPDLDTWVTDYAFGNDYITRPVTEGATYGLQPNWNLTDQGKSILETNQAKVDASITVLSRYAT